MNIYLDENLSEYVADALNFLNKGYFQSVQVLSTKTAIKKAAADEDIIPFIGNMGGVLITRDFNIQKTRLQYDLCKQYKLGMFFLRLPKNVNTHWNIVRLLINNWEKIIQKTDSEKKPFAYQILPKGKMRKLDG